MAGVMGLLTAGVDLTGGIDKNDIDPATAGTFHHAVDIFFVGAELRDDAAPRFIDFCVESVDWSRFGLVGFSLVFQQLLASLALARALKARHPSLPIIFGGAALEDDIADEVMRGCPQVDYAFCGDAEMS